MDLPDKIQDALLNCFCPIKFEFQINNDLFLSMCTSQILHGQDLAQISLKYHMGHTYSKTIFICCLPEIQFLLGILYVYLLNLAICL